MPSPQFGVLSLPMLVLREVEAGQVGMTSSNTNGSDDIGPMQIKSSWLPGVQQPGFREKDQRDNACLKAYVGTWIFYPRVYHPSPPPAGAGCAQGERVWVVPQRAFDIDQVCICRSC